MSVDARANLLNELYWWILIDMGEKSEYDFLVKLIVIGDSGVGKSSLVHQFAQRKFHPDFVSTIGVDFEIREMEVDGKRVKLQCWDCAGNERFRSITTSYFRGAAAVLLVFDVTDPHSIAALPSWLRELRNHNQSAQLILVGNKIDLYRGIDPFRLPSSVQETLERMEPNLELILTSARLDKNVEDAFQRVTANHIRETIAHPPAKPTNVVKLAQNQQSIVDPATPCCK